MVVLDLATAALGLDDEDPLPVRKYPVETTSLSRITDVQWLAPRFDGVSFHAFDADLLRDTALGAKVASGASGGVVSAAVGQAEGQSIGTSFESLHGHLTRIRPESRQVDPFEFKNVQRCPLDIRHKLLFGSRDRQFFGCAQGSPGDAALRHGLNDFSFCGFRQNFCTACCFARPF